MKLGALFFATILLSGAVYAGMKSSDEIEIYRYEVSPQLAMGPGAANELSAMESLGTLGVDAFLVVVRLEPGERFVSAKVEVRDGLFCIPRKRRSRAVVAKIAATLGAQAVLEASGPDLREPLALATTLIPTSRLSAVPAPKLRPRLVLKAHDVEHNQGYVAALLLVASNSVTRLHVESVTTRHKRKKTRHRDRYHGSVPFPAEGESVTRERVMSILAGDGPMNH